MRTSSKIRAFNIFHDEDDLEPFDTVFYSSTDKITEEEVKESLISHDGYEPSIFVEEEF